MRAAARGRGGIGTETILSDRLRPRAPRIAPFCVWLFKSFDEIFFFEHERRNGFQVEGGLRGVR